MNARKCFVSLILILLLIPTLCLCAFAADKQEFSYELSIDGKDTVEVKTGDIITVSLYLNRTDSDEPYTMHAMQDEIRYDSTFFELVEDSATLYSGISSTDIAVEGDYREFYMNYLSFTGGSQWEPETKVGSFQLRVIAESGVTTITNEDYLVSLPDGSGSYPCEAKNLTVILSTQCTVRFETNGGTAIEPIDAIFGETIARPEDPTREGKQLVGWYKDIHLTEPWDFESDTVTGNLTLYAKWEDAPAQAPEETAPPAPTTPAPEKEDGEGCTIGGLPCWIWLVLLILILLIAYLIYRNKKKSSKGKHVGKHVKKRGDHGRKSE